MQRPICINFGLPWWATPLHYASIVLGWKPLPWLIWIVGLSIAFAHDDHAATQCRERGGVLVGNSAHTECVRLEIVP